ncbi:MAG: c-type cytochrome [Burkholderiales bacterium]
MKFNYVIIAAGILLAAGAANASQELATKNQCLACHSVDKKIIGPSFQEVAAKYGSDKDAEAKLVKKVKEGGSGVWGPMAMPPNAAVKDDDIKTLVKWVLAQKK